MVAIHPQYITDTTGERLVILPLSEFNSILEEIDAAEDVQLYQEAKDNDSGERIPMHDAFTETERKRKQAR